MVESLLDKLKAFQLTRRSRRENLIVLMKDLEQKDHSCRDCIGVCCTVEANSMQIDLAQALDIYLFLIANDLFDIDQLNQNIETFRLDKFLGNSGKSLRRYYTCPFYLGEKKGCQISRKSKPYGCLGFNAIGVGVTQGQNCKSYTDNLKHREQKHASLDYNFNQFLVSEFGLIDDKRPIPIKVLEVHHAIGHNFNRENCQKLLSEMN